MKNHTDIIHMPQAVEIEDQLTAAILVDPDDCIKACAGIIQPEDFYRTQNQLIVASAFDLLEKKAPVSLVTIAEDLKAKGELKAAGGASYMARLLKEVPMVTNGPYYARKVKEKSLLRKLTVAGYKIGKLAQDPAATMEAFEQAHQVLSSIDPPASAEGCVSGELMIETVDQIEMVAAGKSQSAMPTGLTDLDRNFGGGFFGSKFIEFVARPGVGKTALMVNVADNISKSFLKRGLGEYVGILELEMDRRELGIRQIASKTGINTTFLYSGKERTTVGWQPLSPETFRAIEEAAGEIAERPIFIDDTPAPYLNEVVRRIRSMHQKGCQIVFIDQLSKIRGPGKTEYEQKTAIVNRLAELKKELRIPIVLLAQVNRGGELKSTGALEEDADIIVRIEPLEEKIGGPTHAPIYKAVFHIDKNRGGATGEIPVQWVPHITTFRNYAQAIYE